MQAVFRGSATCEGRPALGACGDGELPLFKRSPRFHVFHQTTRGIVLAYSQTTYTSTETLTPADDALRDSLLRDENAFWCTLNADGAVLFRNTGFDLNEFYGFASRFNRAFLTTTLGDRNTLSERKELQTVTLGNNDLGFHFEFGNNGRLRPDLLWLYCRRPPAAGTGGETLVTDGAAIFEKLPNEVKTVLLNRRIRYVNYIPSWGFNSMMRHQAIRDVIGEDVMAAIERDGDMRILGSTADGRIVFEVIAETVRPGADGRMHLCQNIFENPYVRPVEQDARHFFSMQVLWEDGTPIEPEIIEALQRAASDSMSAVSWRAGDFLAIDNNRMLHGRRASRDPLRDIVVLCSFSTQYHYASAEQPPKYVPLQLFEVPLL